MLRRAAFSFLPVLITCSLAVGQGGSPPPAPPPTSQSPPPVIVNPGSRSLDTNHSPKLPDAQTQPVAELPPHLKPTDLDGRQNLNDGTKMQLIRVMDAEFVHVRKYFPVGEKNMVIGIDGAVKPGDAQLYRMAQTYGAAARIGDRVQITNIAFHEKSIYLEINGGPKKKSKWYQH